MINRSPRRALIRALRVLDRRSLRGVVSPLLALVMLAGVLVSSPVSAPAAGRLMPMRILSGWSPYWNPDSGPAAIRAMGPLASSVSSFSYSVLGATSIGRRVSLDKYGKMRAAARAARIPFVPSLADATGKLKMQAILADPTTRAAHVNALVTLAVSRGFDGLDLDYEGFAFSDGSATWSTTKPLWTQFIIELAAAMHAEAKLLFVTVPPTYNNNQIRGSGYWVYNLPGIAPHVDRIRIMAYDYSTGRMGPNAPLSWTQKIINYIDANLPPSKVELGVPLYGRDWITGATVPARLGPRRAASRLSAPRVPSRSRRPKGQRRNGSPTARCVSATPFPFTRRPPPPQPRPPPRPRSPTPIPR